jgi:hypothetical protein
MHNDAQQVACFAVPPIGLQNDYASICMPSLMPPSPIILTIFSYFLSEHAQHCTSLPSLSSPHCLAGQTLVAVMDRPWTH